MASIPPLFCSTPPPIDFGDEDDDDTTSPPELTLDEADDEFGDFINTAQSNEDSIDTDVSSLPLPTAYLEICTSTNAVGIDDGPKSSDDKTFVANVSFPHSAGGELAKKIGLNSQPIEAFNFAILESITPPPLDLNETVTESKNTASKEDICKDVCIALNDRDTNEIIEKSIEFEAKDEDNFSLPSLKLDTLSLSSEKQSACSSLAEEDKKFVGVNKIEELSHSNDILPLACEKENESIVKLEDLEDDSSDDERYSPKKITNVEAYEDSEDYFAIRAVNEIRSKIVIPSGLNSQKVLNPYKKTDITCENFELDPCNEHEFDEFAEFQSTSFNIAPKMDTFAKFEPKDSHMLNPEVTFNADFNVLNTLNENLVAEPNSINEANVQTSSRFEVADSDENFVDDEDEFDDFQNFSTEPKITVEVVKKENAPIFGSVTNTNALKEEIESEIDDEFGDFEEAQVSQPNLQTGSKSLTSDNIHGPICISKVNDRLKIVLEMMFPSTPCKETIYKNVNEITSGTDKNRNILKLDSIDTAKALNYQWIHSKVRHSLIKSLGIDSRNILYGEKWNSSMPRFAANLSFNPLEPIKPQQVSHTVPTTESLHSNLLNERIANTLKSDVPAVEFDWNTSGLVNPLDGSKESVHTRETETIYQAQPGKSDAAVEQQQQQQTFSTITNEDNDISKFTVHATTAYTNTTTATSTILSTTTTAALSTIISTVSISNDDDDGNTAGSDDININTILYNSKSKETGSHNNDEVVTTSTFAGPLKETHIYTPSKSDAAISKTTAVTKTTPIDFDYEIAAAGIIIDETVVKKEYRDIVYNPSFILESSSDSKTQQETPSSVSNRQSIHNFLEDVELDTHRSDNGDLNKEKTNIVKSANTSGSEFDDDFSDFQSVPPLPISQPQIQPVAIVPKITNNVINSNSCSNSRTSTPTFGGGNEMILSPAILLPQAISLENSKPKIVWGDTTTNINPDELARIEELFPQPKITSMKSNSSDAMQCNSQKNTPTRSIPLNGYQQQKQTQEPQLSISASIAQKELIVDDDDWTEFVSVPVDSKTQNLVNIHNNINNQNNNLAHAVNDRTFNMSTSSANSRILQWKQPDKTGTTLKTNITETSVNNTNDEEWSDFVSSTPAAPTMPSTPVQLRPATSMLPQFNSASWKNANFYNNPLSFYQSQHQTNVVPKVLQNNNSSSVNNYNNNYQQFYAQQQQRQEFQLQHQQQQLPQQIHIMQDFSTAPPYNRTLNASASPTAINRNVPPGSNNAQFQLGSAKVAPSISLIPDLGFVAPAAPTHMAFVNSLPKPSFSTNTKK